MRKITSIFFLTLNFCIVFAQEKMKMEDQKVAADIKVISDFIDCIKFQKKEKLLTKISFPFEREYPIPAIKNKLEFLERYNEVFDDSLIKMIVNSKPSENWSAVGWRGIMLFSGDLWLDYDGRLIAVNYQSEVEKKKRDKLIKIEKSDLYPSIQKFESPEYILETETYRIRIDDLGNGKYRYASWAIKNKMSDKPELVLENGEFIPEGSGGNHRFEFKNGDYIYDCSIIIMGEDDSPPARLTIYKLEREILSQKANIVLR